MVVDCTFLLPGSTEPKPCIEIPPIDSLICSCAECVREVSFVYTGTACGATEDCEDTSFIEPGSPATVAFTPCESDFASFEGTVQAGETITISGGALCLPECMVVTVSDPLTGEVAQITQIDSSCFGRGLILTDSYGAVDFVGYSCDSTDILSLIHI